MKLDLAVGILSVCCFVFSPAIVRADKHHAPEEHKHPEISYVLGLDMSPALRAESMSWIGLHLGLEKEINATASLEFEVGIEYLFSPAEGPPPDQRMIFGAGVSYLRHLDDGVEVGGGIEKHFGVPGLELVGIVGKEMSERVHIHGAFGLTLGENSDGEEDLLIGPFIFGAGIRLN